MPVFLTRIELRGDPDQTDYDRVFEAVRRAGFRNTIATAFGVFELPHGTFASYTYGSSPAAAQAASGVVTEVWKECGVIAAGSDFFQVNLKRVQ